MAKIDLNDGYRMIPLARDHYQLPSFQIRQRERVQFQCLPFRFCTTPFVFMKVTKPVVQFLRHLRIHLIIYLDDLLLAAPSTTQLLQDMSTAMQLFTALVFLVNYPQSIMHPTQRLQFLGFMVDTNIEPPHKIEAIRKEAPNCCQQGKHKYTSLGFLWQPIQPFLQAPSLFSLEYSGPDLLSSYLPILSSPITSSADGSKVVDNQITTTLLHNNFENRNFFRIRLGSSLSGSAHWRQMNLHRIGSLHQLP